MKNAIWGTGYNASKYYKWTGSENVDFFIDQNPQKRGMYLGKKVVSPSDIKNWHDLFIYVPHNYYGEIKEYLQSKGLEETSDFQKYDDKFRIPIRNAKRSLEESVKKLKENEKAWNGSSIFISVQLNNKKSYFDFFQSFLTTNDNLNIISEEFWYKQEMLERVFNAKVLMAPEFIEHYTLITGNVVSKDRTVPILNSQFFINIIDQVLAIFPEAEYAEAAQTVWLSFKFMEALLGYINPQSVICYDSMSPSHIILENLCNKRAIPIIFTHPGVIPGTLAFDIGGEMGKSLPAIKATGFSHLSVSKGELDQAKKVWEYLFESKLNRKIQPKVDFINRICQQIQSERPIIFFAGQNDVFSRMIPYTEDTKRYHSPMFKNSLDAAIFLSKICKANNWNFIYKPHPMYSHPEQAMFLPDNVIFVEFGDINEFIDFSDVTITILSAASYNALIRYKPVVMLGYTQLRGKGCTYEAFEEEKIEHAIKDALDNGFTQEQQEAFLLHMAQCLKYYLYDDLQERPIRYGRPVPKSIDEFYELERLLHAEDVRKEKT